MALGRLTVRLRPIRHLLLIPPGSRKALLTAIRINTFLWGGTFNAIIPVLRRGPRKWHDALIRVSAQDILSGYVDAFDPDFLTRVGNVPTIPGAGREVIASDDILKDVADYGTPNYGVGLLEIIQHFCREELRFVRHKPVEIVLPILDKHHYLFLSAVFGSLPPDLELSILDKWADLLAPSRPAVTLTNYFEFLEAPKLFWRRLSSYRIRHAPRRVPVDSDTLFLLDATSLTDIIDYWNLRAAGWPVYPVVKQALGLEPLRQRLLQLVEEAFAPYRSNPKFYHHVQIVPAQSCTKKDIIDFLAWLDVPPPPADIQASKVIGGYYPRLWDKWARSRGEEPGALEVETQDHDVSAESTPINVRTLPPVFAARFAGGNTHRYANDISIHYYGATEIMAEVIPPGPDSLVRAIGGIGFDDWRFANSGLVYLSRYKESTISLTPPRAEDLFREWLNSKGWKASISPPGRLAKQMLKQLGGTWGTELLANRRLLDLLGRMSQGKPIGKQAFWGEIQRVAQEERYVKDPMRTLENLTKAHVFQLGLQLQCPICVQRSWYSITEADYELRCPKCLESFRLPEHSLKDIEWAYRTIGPFSLESRSHGVYCVLLTFRFFTRVLDDRHTTILSFEAKKDGKSLEADLGLLLRETAWWRPTMQIVFCECKTFNRFGERDAQRMRNIAREFPGAVLVFATLNQHLSNGEKRLLRPLANRGRRHWKAEMSLNPVLVLTGTELFSDRRPGDLWRETGGKHAQVAGQIGWAPGILKLCDATQQLYLDMPPWFQWFEEQMRRRRTRRQAGSAMSPAGLPPEPQDVRPLPSEKDPV